MVGPAHYLVLSAILFTIGVVGVLTRKNAIIVFMSIEIMLNAANLALVTFAVSIGDMAGLVMALLVIAVAAAEAAVGLSIIVAMFRHRETVNVEAFNMLRG
ncbi:NADH-quinone oxidoreductase subunit NuoK [soil metagenome]|jgi:NADH-quinone oxidoreductase subunit K|nr:NADH-quinone oxidoreductase subunit NuoK [Chloroflexota bacterium]